MFNEISFLKLCCPRRTRRAVSLRFPAASRDAGVAHGVPCLKSLSGVVIVNSASPVKMAPHHGAAVLMLASLRARHDSEVILSSRHFAISSLMQDLGCLLERGAATM